MNSMETSESQQNFLPMVNNSASVAKTGGIAYGGDLNDELCFVRRILGYSQQQLANKIGVSKNAISIYETKRDAVSLVTALKMHFLLEEYLKNPKSYNLRDRQVQSLNESREVFYRFCRSQLAIDD